MKSKFSKLYKRIFVYARPYLGLLFLGMILAAVASAMDGALAWLVKPVLDDIFVAKKATMLKFLPV
ncbi:MAG: ABC transporter ATP-binding protein, partial [Deltaproteobacteria bacterium]|nr:ABC transporter ATP-binding protein [Deltaproteobacteria bacterium]